MNEEAEARIEQEAPLEDDLVSSGPRRIPSWITIIDQKRNKGFDLGDRVAGILVQEWARRHAPTDQIREISTLAVLVIGDSQKAVRWLSEPNLATDRRPPIDLLGEDDGYERVKNLLLRVEVGALA